MTSEKWGEKFLARVSHVLLVWNDVHNLANGSMPGTFERQRRQKIMEKSKYIHDQVKILILLLLN